MTSNVSPKVAQQLLQVMQQDTDLAVRLKAILQEEKKCLEQRQYAAHQELVKDKTQLLLQLDHADNERKHLMESMGFAADRAGFFAFLAHVPSSWKDRYMNTWETLSDTMNTCARLNKVNGKILAHSQNALERLLVIVRGHGNQPAIYQANGRRNLGAAQRILATA